MQSLFQLETAQTRLQWQALKVASHLPLDAEQSQPTGHFKLTAAPSITIEGQGLNPVLACHPLPLQQTLPGPALYEQSTYRLNLRAKQGQCLRLVHADPEIQARLMPFDPDESDRIVAELNFGSQVGLTRFEIWVDGLWEYTLELEIFPSKLSYKEDFQLMLAEVQEILSALAFQYLSSTYLGAKTNSPARNTDLEWVLLFEHILQELGQALQHIARQPVRQMQAERNPRPLHQIRKVDARLRQAIRKGQGHGPKQALSANRALYTYYDAPRPHYTLDTPEHRWLAQSLQAVRQRLAQILAHESQRHYGRSEHLAKLQAMERQLAQWQGLEPLAAASTSVSADFSSLQLMRATGYREAYRALWVLRLGLKLEGEALNVSLKDIATLYEYWTYLRMVQLLASQSQAPPQLQELIAVQQNGLQVRLTQGRSTRTRFWIDGAKVELYYNPQLRQEALLPQRPDLLLEIHRPGWPVYRAVLDAKYRIDYQAQTRQRLGIPAPPAEALNVLHRYRDAILADTQMWACNEPPQLSRNVVQGLALYPYVVPKASDYWESALYRIFQRIGVGALPVVPSQPEFLTTWLDHFIRQTPWSLAHTQAPLVLQPALRQAANEGVLLGTLRGQNPQEHWDWLQSNTCYYLPASQAAHGRQWQVQWVALYFPRQLSPTGQGVVCYRGRVQQIALLPRDQLKTPWPTKHSSDAVIVYSVQAWEPIAEIPNLRGERVNPRWTTRLALERASDLNTLLLETVPEWTLYEALQRENIPFELRAERIPSLEQAGGHACFVLTNDLRIRYLGAQGYVLQQGTAQWTETSINQLIKKIER